MNVGWSTLTQDSSVEVNCVLICISGVVSLPLQQEFILQGKQEM